MRTLYFFCGLLLLVVDGRTFDARLRAADAAEPVRPNVIVIMADDKYVPGASKPRKYADLWCCSALFRQLSF